MIVTYQHIHTENSDFELWILFFNREDILYDRWQMNLNKSKDLGPVTVINEKEVHNIVGIGING